MILVEYLGGTMQSSRPNFYFTQVHEMNSLRNLLSSFCSKDEILPLDQSIDRISPRSRTLYQITHNHLL